MFQGDTATRTVPAPQREPSTDAVGVEDDRLRSAHTRSHRVIRASSLRDVRLQQEWVVVYRLRGVRRNWRPPFTFSAAFIFGGRDP
jgi:hypothetical protein